LGASLTQDGADEIARRSRGTPRIAGRLLRRVRDFAEVRSTGTIDREWADKALTMFGVDQNGLTKLDRRLLNVVCRRYTGGPVGIEALATTLGEEPDTLIEVYEPYLIQEGYLQRSPRGRMATIKAYRLIGLAPPEKNRGLLDDLEEPGTEGGGPFGGPRLG
jgi:Holliday junction DNA helicase RuvB